MSQGDATLRFGATDDGSIAAAVRRAASNLKTFTSSANEAGESIGKTFKVLGSAAIVAGIAKLTSQSIEFADSMTKVSQQTGIALDALQELSFFATQADVEFGALTAGVNRLQRALANAEDGQRNSAEVLRELGINAQEFAGLEPDKQFEAVAKAIASIETPASRTQAAMDLFGRSGAELIPVMQAIAKESDAIGIAFDRIGGAVADDAIAKVDALGDAASGVGLSVKSLGVELVALAAPPIIAALEGLQAFFGGLRVLIGDSADEVTRLEDEIRSLERSRNTAVDVMGRPIPGLQARYDEQIKELQKQQRRQLGLDEERPLGIPIDLGSLDAPTLTSGQFEQTDEEKARQKALEERDAANVRRAEEAEARAEREIQRQFDREKKADEDRMRESLSREQQFAEAKLGINTQYYEFLDHIRETFRLREIKLEEIKNQNIFGLATELFSGLAAKNSEFAKIQQRIAIAMTIWSTATGVMNAFRDLPWPANLAAAAKVALTGAIQVAKIKATNYNSGGGSAPTFSGGSSFSGSETAPAQELPRPEAMRATNVYINGVVTQSVVDQLLNGLKDGFNRDVVIIEPNSAQAAAIRGTG